MHSLGFVGIGQGRTYVDSLQGDGAAGRWIKLKSGDEFRINPNILVTSDLETILGPGRVQFARHGNGNGRNGG